MGIHFPDLQVLMPRADEISRTLPLAHQQDAHQQSLALAMKVEAERQRRRVARSRSGQGASATGRQQTARTTDSPIPPRPDGLGHRVDVRV